MWDGVVIKLMRRATFSLKNTITSANAPRQISRLFLADYVCRGKKMSRVEDGLNGYSEYFNRLKAARDSPADLQTFFFFYFYFLTNVTRNVNDFLKLLIRYVQR